MSEALKGWTVRPSKYGVTITAPSGEATEIRNPATECVFGDNPVLWDFLQAYMQSPRAALSDTGEDAHEHHELCANPKGCAGFPHCNGPLKDKPWYSGYQPDPTAAEPGEDATQWDGKAYKQMADQIEEWKQRALSAESDMSRLCDELNNQSGPTFMGEPVLPDPTAAEPGEGAKLAAQFPLTGKAYPGAPDDKPDPTPAETSVYECDCGSGGVCVCGDHSFYGPQKRLDPTTAVVGSMVEPVDDDDPVVKIGRIGNELHNHSLGHQEDSDEYEFLSDVAVRLWASQNQIRSRIADLERQLSEARAEADTLKRSAKIMREFHSRTGADLLPTCNYLGIADALDSTAARLQEEG